MSEKITVRIKPCPYCGREATRYHDADPCKRYELIHERTCFIVSITKRMVTYIPIKDKSDGRITGMACYMVDELVKQFNTWNQRT